MKKLFLLLLAVLFLSACESEETTSKYEQLREDPQAAEDEFIKSTTENLIYLQDELAELKPLFAQVKETDSWWIVKVDSSSVSLGMAGNNVSEIYLNDEQKEKYEETLAANETAIIEIEAIRDDINKSMETYDNKALNSIYARIGEAESLVQSALDHLSAERYE